MKIVRGDLKKNRNVFVPLCQDILSYQKIEKKSRAMTKI